VKILLATRASNNFWSDANDDYFALVDTGMVSGGLGRIRGVIEALMKAKEVDPQAYKVMSWMPTDYYTLSPELKDLLVWGESELENSMEYLHGWTSELLYYAMEKYGFIPVCFELVVNRDLKLERTELDFIRGYKDGFSFQCNPKHSDVVLCTKEVSSMYINDRGFDAASFLSDVEMEYTRSKENSG